MEWAADTSPHEVQTLPAPLPISMLTFPTPNARLAPVRLEESSV
jgi:hypothetical protein